MMKQHYDTYEEMLDSARATNNDDWTLQQIFRDAWTERTLNWGDPKRYATQKAKHAIVNCWNNHDRTQKPTVLIHSLWFIGVWMLWEETVGKKLDVEQRAAQ